MLVGLSDGDIVGSLDNNLFGLAVGLLDDGKEWSLGGDIAGLNVGSIEGDAVGKSDGLWLGFTVVGDLVGDSVGDEG